MSHERLEPDETLSSIDERRNTMPNSKAGCGEQFQEGDHMETKGESAASSPKAKRLPELPTEAPTNMAVVHVWNYVPKVEVHVLKGVAGRDVVIVARGSELAAHMATRFAASGGSLWVVDCLDPLAREGYLSWLGKLARRHPRTRVLFGVLGLDRTGHHYMGIGELEITEVMKTAQRDIRKAEPRDEDEEGEPNEPDNR